MRYWRWPGGWGHGTTGCVVLSAAEREQLAAIVADCNRPRKHGERAPHRACLGRSALGAAGGANASASAGRRCGGGNNASPRAGSRVYCPTRPASPGKAPTAAEATARVVALTPAFARAALRRTAASGDPLDRPGDGQSHRHLAGFGAADLLGRNKLQSHRLPTFKRSHDPSFIAKPARTADQARALPNHEARLQAARHDHAIRHTQRARRHRDWRLHAAPTATPNSSAFSRPSSARSPAGKIIHTVLDNYATPAGRTAKREIGRAAAAAAQKVNAYPRSTLCGSVILFGVTTTHLPTRLTITSTKIPKYQYVGVNFSILARCGKRRSGDWIGGSNGSTSSSDRAAD